ncbi:MAG: acyltransferase [Sporomusaceae bacterium]|nr:acyltransferase [Sporomusaceae bacterium]
MAKQRILSVEYIRGIAMLGVVGIHTGAYSLTNPKVNIQLFALLEIVSRFSVPIFFFVSAFGLFWAQNLTAPFSYGEYLRKRAKTVLIPYLVWSCLYLLHSTYLTGDTSFWRPRELFDTLFFGLASYQLYFLVILLWFYLFMPVWRYLLKILLSHPVYFIPLLILQIVFDFYSSYCIPAVTGHRFVDHLIEYRLNYWVLHYLFIFLLGGYCAQNFVAVSQAVKRHKNAVLLFITTTLIAMLGLYYYLLFGLHYTPEQAVNTGHQLSPFGILYTVAASLFFIMWFESYSPPTLLASLLRSLSTHSYLVYLVHPFFMYYLSRLLEKENLLFTGFMTLCFYSATVLCSLLFAACLNHYKKKLPLVSLLLTGNRQ